MATADAYMSTTAGPTGEATITIQTGTRFQSWTVEQVSVEMPAAPVGASCALRKNGVLISPLIATGDVADGSPPIPLRPGETMTVEWAGCTPGDVGNVYVLYDDGQEATV